MNKEGYFNHKTKTFLHITKDCIMDCNPKSYKYILELEKEIDKSNNIIDEFDKWLLSENIMFYKSDDGGRLIRYGETKNKWLELKEGK